MVRPVRTRTISGREATGSRFLSCRPACGEISCSFECVLCSATAWPDLYSPETRVRREKTLQIVSTVVRDKTAVTRDARDHARETERPQRDSGRARGARVQPCTVWCTERMMPRAHRSQPLRDRPMLRPHASQRRRRRGRGRCRMPRGWPRLRASGRGRESPERCFDTFDRII